MTIKSKPATKKYREGWDRIFIKRKYRYFDAVEVVFENTPKERSLLDKMKEIKRLKNANSGD